MIKEAIKMLVNRENLSEYEMIECMNEIMEGNATGAQISAFLTALSMKGETIEEISGAVRVMRKKVRKIKAPEGVIDTCGTGGDMLGTFNISTTTALVVCASGIPVAKHGNRSVSSQSGSADVLEALGVKIDLEPDKVEKCLFETGFGFLFAPLFHPAMKYAAGPRREIGIKTIFNILGPLTNPADARHQILGVFDGGLTETLARVLARLGAEHVMVVHGEDGLDEISISSKTRVSYLKDGNLKNYYIEPEDFGLPRSKLEYLHGGDREHNAEITLSILRGEQGPRRDIVLMNSAAAIVIAGKTNDFKTAVSIAAEAIDSKNAFKKLQEIRKVTNNL